MLSYIDSINGNYPSTKIVPLLKDMPVNNHLSWHA
jgi:hypothetical protein